MAQNPGLGFEEQAQDSDAIRLLEERIGKIVALVGRLRTERDAAVEEAVTARAAAERAEAEVRSLKQGGEDVVREVASLKSETASLKTERQQVRARLEKLLDQIDQLGS